MQTKHFINLTNGIEKLLDCDISIDELNFMYIASTTIERKDYLKLFIDLDHNFLFNLAIGNNVVFYDFGTRRKNSKTCYIGINLIRYVLTRFWLDNDNKVLAYRNTRGSKTFIGEYNYYSKIYDSLFTYNMTKDKVKEI